MNEEIQKLIGALKCGCPDEVSCEECPGWNWCSKHTINREDAAAYLIEYLVGELERVKKERDAAIADMEKLQGLICRACMEYHQPDPNVRKWTCRVYGDAWGELSEDGLLACGSFKWRGVPKEV